MKLSLIITTAQDKEQKKYATCTKFHNQKKRAKSADCGIMYGKA